MEEKKKLVITIAITLFMVLLFTGILLYQFSVLGVTPMKGVKSLTTVIEKKEKELNALKARISVELPQRKMEMTKLQPLAKEANQLLPKSVTVEELLKFINSKAELALVDVTSIADKKVKPKTSMFGVASTKNFDEIEYTMNMTGTLDEIALFINYMEMFEIKGKSGNLEKRLFSVKDLKIKAAKSGLTEGGRHKVTMKMSTYVKKKDAVLPAAF